MSHILNESNGNISNEEKKETPPLLIRFRRQRSRHQRSRHQRSRHNVLPRDNEFSGLDNEFSGLDNEFSGLDNEFSGLDNESKTESVNEDNKEQPLTVDNQITSSLVDLSYNIELDSEEDMDITNDINAYPNRIEYRIPIASIPRLRRSNAMAANELSDRLNAVDRLDSIANIIRRPHITRYDENNLPNAVHSSNPVLYNVRQTSTLSSPSTGTSLSSPSTGTSLSSPSTGTSSSSSSSSRSIVSQPVSNIVYEDSLDDQTDEQTDEQMLYGIYSYKKTIPCPIPNGCDVEAKSILLICQICHSNQVSTAIFPCMHCCLCDTCAHALSMVSNVCPMCRSGIKYIAKIYLCDKRSHSKSDDDDIDQKIKPQLFKKKKSAMIVV
jgi:hypothetical protein